MNKGLLKIMVSCVAVGVATTGVYAYSIYNKTTQAIEKIGTSEPVLAAQSANIKPLTFLLMGVDYRKQTASLNSDVIMVVTVNPESGSATLVSLPRDLQMTPKGLPSRKANYYYPYFNLQNKDTAFVETKKIFSSFMDIPIDYMVTVDFDGFRQLIDLMGGLTLNVDMDMRYVDEEDGTNINLKKGVATLNGKQTLDFVRYRKSNRGTEESGDAERNQRQQQVLGELMSSLKSAGGVAKLSQIIETVGNHIHTDIPSRQIRNLLGTYFDIKPESVKYVHLDGAWESPYIVVKEQDLEQARTALKQQLGESQPSMAAPASEDAGMDTNSGKATRSGTGMAADRNTDTNLTTGAGKPSNSGAGSGTGTPTGSEEIGSPWTAGTGKVLDTGTRSGSANVRGSVYETGSKSKR